MKKIVFLFLIVGIAAITLVGCGDGSSKSSNNTGNNNPGGGTPPTNNFELSADANTVALWHFNETTGTTAYDSTNNHLDLTLGHYVTGTSDPTFVSDGRSQMGNCLSFTQANRSFLSRGPFTIPANFTVEFWMKTSYNDQFGSIDIMRSNLSEKAIEIGIYQGTVRLSVTDCKGDGSAWATAISAKSVNDNQWHYVACTYKSGSPAELKIYVDGSLSLFGGASSVTTTLNPAGALSQLYVGGLDYALNYCFDGSLDEIRFSNKERTSQEIADYYSHFE